MVDSACQHRDKEMQVQSLDRENALEEEMVTHSSILAWKIPWTENSGGLQSIGSQKAVHDWSNSAYALIHYPSDLES